MACDPRVLELLEELLGSGRTPEEVCRDCPELLPEVRERWRRFGPIDAELGAMFPDPGEASEHTRVAAGRPSVPVSDLPQVPGYDVAAVLGHGGMGVVYRATHLRLNRPAALKMLLSGPFARPEERERFRREAEAVAGLQHPNIVQVHDAGEYDGRPYFTMELMEGGTLVRKLAGTPLPARDAAALVAALADAVRVAHAAGIVHRDLKPSNVLLAADGTPKVSDFGLALRVDGGPVLTRTGVAMGTPSYMSPCQARGDKGALGPGTDIYALGAILYECLTGRPPFKAESALETLQQVLAQDPVPPSRLNARVPRDLETICLKCLEKDPAKRYPTAAALAADLRRFERGEPILARPVGSMERLGRWVRRHPSTTVTSLGVVMVVLALGAVGVWWYGQHQAARRADDEALKANRAAVEEDLVEADRLRQQHDYAAAAAALRRAQLRLRSDAPAELHDLLARASRNLGLERKLDDIRLNRVLAAKAGGLDEVFIHPANASPSRAVWRTNRTPPGREYEAAFRDAGLGTPPDDPGEVARRVKDSPISPALVAALDDWAACAVDQDQRRWALDVARRADPDPWRDRIRDPDRWLDRMYLTQLAVELPPGEQPPHLLVILGGRLQASGEDPTALLVKVVLVHPNDFWANVGLGIALYVKSPLEAAGRFLTALAVRPNTASLHAFVGSVYLHLRRFAEAAAHFEHAIRLDPTDAFTRNGYGFTLDMLGRKDEALAQLQESVRLDPQQPGPRINLGKVLADNGRLGDAFVQFQKATCLNREDRGGGWRSLNGRMIREGRGQELRHVWKATLAENPPEHDAWFGYAELCLFLGNEAEYRLARTELLAQFGETTNPDVAERTGRACLLLSASADELRQAVALVERAVAVGRRAHEFNYPYYRFAEGLARYRQGRFDDTITIMTGDAAKSLGPCPGLVLAMAQYQKGQKDDARRTLQEAIRRHDWTAKSADHQDVWIAHILRREAETLIGTDRPAVPEVK